MDLLNRKHAFDLHTSHPSKKMLESNIQLITHVTIFQLDHWFSNKTELKKPEETLVYL